MKDTCLITDPGLRPLASRLNRRQVLKTSGALAAGAAAAPLIRRSTSAQNTDLGEAELTFFFGANVAEAETRQQIVDAFMAKYPQIKVELRRAEGDAAQELQVMAAAGDAPDVMMAWELGYPALALRGLYADLNEFFANDPEFKAVADEEFVPSLLQMFNWDGKQYVLPEQYAGVVLYYNKKLFDEAGLEPPPPDWTETSWTYDKFLETAQALTKESGGRVSQFGFAGGWWPPLSSVVWATNNGGNWFDPYVNPTKSTIADPKFVEGVQFYADLANVHHVMPTAEEASAQLAEDMFIGGSAAMVLVGHWFYPAFSEAEGLEFDIGVFPVGPQGTTPVTDLGSTGLAISATTEYPEQAWEFVKFSTGPEGQAIIAESGLFVPVVRSVGQSEAFLGSHEKLENAQVFIEAMEHSVPLPITPVWPEVSDAWSRATVDRILNGNEKAADVYAELEPQLTEILANQGS